MAIAIAIAIVERRCTVAAPHCLWSKNKQKLRAPKIAIANCRDCLSQTSSSPAKLKWGHFFPRKIAQRIVIACDFSSQEKIARLSAWGKGTSRAENSLCFFTCVIVIAIAIAELFATLGALRTKTFSEFSYGKEFPYWSSGKLLTTFLLAPF